MIKEFEPPFFYRTPKLIENKIRASQLTYQKTKLDLFSYFFHLKAFSLMNYLTKKIDDDIPSIILSIFCSYNPNIKNII